MREFDLREKYPFLYYKSRSQKYTRICFIFCVDKQKKFTRYFLFYTRTNTKNVVQFLYCVNLQKKTSDIFYFIREKKRRIFSILYADQHKNVEYFLYNIQTNIKTLDIILCAGPFRIFHHYTQYHKIFLGSHDYSLQASSHDYLQFVGEQP